MAIQEAHLKWFDIGLELDLTVTELDEIEESNHNYTELCLFEMLLLWMKKNGHCTWSPLVDALQSPTVGHEELAEHVKTFQVGEFIG